MNSHPSESAPDLLVVRVPPFGSAMTYRAYGELLADQTVLDWSVNRLCCGLGTSVRTVCVCDTARERELILNAHGGSEPLEVVSIQASDETHLYKALIEQYSPRTIFVCGVSHALAGIGFTRRLLDCHRTLVAEMTDLVDATFVDPLFIVESSLARDLLSYDRPEVPSDIIQRATALKTAEHRGHALARDFRWLRVSAQKHLKLEGTRWPERIAIRSARDVQVLRNAISRGSVQGTEAGLIEAWKRATTETRGQRISSIRSAKRPAARTYGKPARVLYASIGAGFTGAQQSLCHLVAALDRARYEPLGLVSYSGTLRDQLRALGVKVLCPEEDIAESEPENVAFARRLLARYAPDLVHANHAVGMPLTAATLCAGIPFVQHVRVQKPMLLRPQIHAAEVVIAVSQFVRDRVVGMDVDPRRVEVIWNGVDVCRFRPPSAGERCRARAVLGIAQEEFVVTMIARLARNKRHDTVIDAVGQMRRRIGRGHLVLVGDRDGQRAYGHAVHNHIREQRLAAHVSTIDFVPDVRPILYATNVLALLAEDEPLSRAVLEAMALGVPVISGDSGGTQEVLDDGRTGYVVQCGDAAKLTAKLCELALDPLQAAMIGRAAATQVQTSLTANQCALKTMNVYDRVLSGYYACNSCDGSRSINQQLWHSDMNEE